MCICLAMVGDVLFNDATTTSLQPISSILASFFFVGSVGSLISQKNREQETFPWIT